jgi:hypothetical protein
MNYYEKYYNYKNDGIMNLSVPPDTAGLSSAQVLLKAGVKYEQIPKYYMGWKFRCNKNNKKNNNKKNIININKKNNLANKSIINNKLIPRQYNIYKEYPYYFPPIIDQKNINCCVPICISTIYYYLTFKQNNIIKTRISSLYLYYLVKIYNNIGNDSLDSLDSNEDSGVTIMETLKILKKRGCCPEFLYTYTENNFNSIPNEKLLNLTNKCKLINFTKILRFEIKQNLINNNPVICGIKVFNSFHSTKTIETGIIDLPQKFDYLLGGHSIIIVGYNDYIESYIFINSWGSSWGDNGFGIIPYSYINNKNYSDEFFIINNITDPDFFLVNNINNYKNDITIIIFLLLLLLLLQIKIS